MRAAVRDSRRDSTPKADIRETVKERLRSIIIEKSLHRDGNFRLASGAVSSFYFDMKPTMLDPEGAHLISECILEHFETKKWDWIGGLEIGAVPIVAVVAMKSYLKDPQDTLKAFFVRKAAKTHGTQRRIEGVPRDVSLKGVNVLIVDDVTTRGASALEAVEAARAAGAIVDTIVTVVDRLEGAAENLAPHGIRLVPILTVDDFR